MHGPADAVTDEAADDGEAGILGIRWNRLPKMSRAAAFRAALLDPGLERGLADLEAGLGLGRDSPTGT